MTVDEMVDGLRPCTCGCPKIDLHCEGNDESILYAECSFCGKTTESSTELREIMDDWNLRGPECVECGEKCEDPEDELCPACWARPFSGSPNSAICAETHSKDGAK